MTDFAHLFYDDAKPDEEIDPAKKRLDEIDTQAYFAEAILGELEGTGSPTILAMWFEARDAYVASAKALIDLDPFSSDDQKERFIRAQGEARRYRDMISWLQKHAEAYRRAQDFNRDEEVQRIRREQQQNERPSE